MRWGVVILMAIVGLVHAQNVGIGIATPQAKVHIQAPATYTQPLLQVDNTTAAAPFLLVTNAGNVGIQLSAPTQALDVNGNVQFSGALMPGGNAGVAGQVLVSQGAGVAPVWKDVLGSGTAIASICTTAQTNYVQKWTGTELCNTIIQDDGAGVGVNAAPQTNVILYAYRPSTAYGAGYATIYGYRAGTSGSSNGGSSWSTYGIDAAIKGYSLWGNRYSAGVAGFSFLDYDTSAAVIGAKYNGSIFTGLAYRDEGGKEYAIFSYGNLRAEHPNHPNTCFFYTTDSVLNVGSCNADNFQDGNSYTLGGWSTIVDYVADFDRGSSRGTAVGVGSIEYFIDGEASMFVNYGFSPIGDNAHSLGQSGHRWSAVWAANGTIQTSDEREKNILGQPSYGLNEILQIQPILFQWKNSRDDRTYIGLSAQQLMNIVPEAVITHEWVPVSENPVRYEKRPVKALGIQYSALIPVLINAIKEQQEQIKALEQEIETLKRQLNH